MSEATARSLILAVNSACFGALWGVMLAPKGGGLVGVMMGFAMGLLASPIAVLALRRRTIGLARWMWLAMTTITVAMVAAFRVPPGVALIVVPGAYIGSCMLARFLLPELVEWMPGRCRACGYDLSGLGGQDSTCPECGFQRPD